MRKWLSISSYGGWISGDVQRKQVFEFRKLALFPSHTHTHILTIESMFFGCGSWASATSLTIGKQFFFFLQNLEFIIVFMVDEL